MRICLDAGHGGKDSGAVGTKNSFEKDIALDICKKVGGYAKQQGFDVVYTRTSDIFLELSERADIANKNNCDVFVSIHNNSFSDQKANGIETWCFPDSDNGEKLASMVQKNVIQSTALTNRGVKMAKFAVLRMTKMVSVLVECAFISNVHEEELLKNNDFKNKIAMGIIKGINQYFNIPLKQITNSDNKVPQKKEAVTSLNKNDTVLKVQKLLNSIKVTDYGNNTLVEDGILGEKTKAAFKKLKEKYDF